MDVTFRTGEARGGGWRHKMEEGKIITKVSLIEYGDRMEGGNGSNECC